MVTIHFKWYKCIWYDQNGLDMIEMDENEEGAGNEGNLYSLSILSSS